MPKRTSLDMTLNAKGESNQILVDKEVHSTNLLLDIDEKPELFQGLLLSFQHVFAMFGATILVPLILGMPVSVALFASGCGTLIYQVATKFKVPVYLGSSFAYITAMALAMKQMHGDISAAQTGILFVGLIYVVVATVIKFVGNSWVDKILPPIIIGPMIIVIGLGLANSAVTNAGFVAKGDWRKMLVAVVRNNSIIVVEFAIKRCRGRPFLFDTHRKGSCQLGRILDFSRRSWERNITELTG